MCFILIRSIYTFPDSYSVLKKFHSGERIQKVADSSAGFTGYVWTEAESGRKEKVADSKISGYVWTGRN